MGSSDLTQQGKTSECHFYERDMAFLSSGYLPYPLKKIPGEGWQRAQNILNQNNQTCKTRSFFFNNISSIWMTVHFGYRRRLMYSICIPSIPFLSFFFLIVGSWLYNVVLVSAVQQCESVIILYMSPPSWTCFRPTPLGHQRVPGWAPCVVQKLPTSYLFYTWCIYGASLVAQW